MYLQFTLCISLLIGLFLFPTASHLGAEQGVSIFFDTLLPYILPYLLLTNWLFALLQRTTVSPRSAFIISYLTSAIGGYPVGAIATIALIRQQLVTKRQAAWLLPFLHSPNPFFVINYVGNDLLQNVKFSIMYLVLHHIISIIAVVIIYRRTIPQHFTYTQRLAIRPAIFEQTANTTLTIAITIIFFSSLAYICIEAFLNAINTSITTVVIGALELTNGLQFAAHYLQPEQLPIYYAFLLTAQSISIHLQVSTVIIGQVSIRPYFYIRFLLTVIFTLIFGLYYVTF